MALSAIQVCCKGRANRRLKRTGVCHGRIAADGRRGVTRSLQRNVRALTTALGGESTDPSELQAR
jgi:hypothetical protein